MTDTLIKLRRSAVPGKTPTDAQMQLGEVAINTYDGKMFFKQSSTSNSILEVATTFSPILTNLSLVGSLTANNSTGTAGQVLTTNGSSVYWNDVVGGAGGANLSQSANSSAVTIFSDSGTDAVITEANQTNAGLMTALPQIFSGQKTFANTAIFNGNVGVGISSPAAKLHANGQIRSDKSYYEPGVSIYHSGTSSSGKPALLIEQSVGSAGYSGIHIKRGSTDGLGLVTFGTKSDPTLTVPEWFAGITGAVGTGWDSQFRIGRGTVTSFGESGNGQTLKYDLTILSNGNIGIGTATPGTKLDVFGSIRGYNTGADVEVAAGRLGDSIYYNSLATYSGYNDSRASISLSQGFDGSFITYAVSRTLKFIDCTGATAYERMRINSIGNVGIGNTAPVSRLDVSGDISLRNSTTPTSAYIYNTYTDTSNYEQGFVRWTSNSFQIGTTYLGTGVRRGLVLGNGGTDGGLTTLYCGNFAGSNITIAPSGTARLVIDYTNIRPYSDNIYPLGQSDRRFQSLYVNAGVYNGDSLQKTESSTVASITQTQIASFAVSSFRSGKFVVQAYDSVTGEVQVSELLIAQNGTTASATEYGVVYTGSAALVIYDVDISAGNVRLLATRSTTNSTQYKVSETLIIA